MKILNSLNSLASHLSSDKELGVKLAGAGLTGAAESLSYGLRYFYAWPLVRSKYGHQWYQFLYNTGNLVVGYAGAMALDEAARKAWKLSGKSRMAQLVSSAISASIASGMIFLMEKYSILTTGELNDVYAGMAGAGLYTIASLVAGLRKR